MSRFVRLAAAVLVAASLLAGAARPAAAHTGSCAGGVDLVSSQAVTYPLISPYAAAGFSFQPTSLTFCTGALTLTGTFMLGCGLASGAGIWATHHSFSYVSTGGLLVFSGGLNGTLALVPAVGQSCFTGVNRFLAVGALAMV